MHISSRTMFCMLTYLSYLCMDNIKRTHVSCIPLILTTFVPDPTLLSVDPPLLSRWNRLYKHIGNWMWSAISIDVVKDGPDGQKDLAVVHKPTSRTSYSEIEAIQANCMVLVCSNGFGCNFGVGPVGPVVSCCLLLFFGGGGEGGDPSRCLKLVALPLKNPGFAPGWLI